MQLTSALTLLATLAASVSANTCDVCRDGALINHITLTASGVDDIPGRCGGLWDNLKRFADCATPSATSCGGSNGNLEWKFAASSFCNAGMIESTFYEATKNEFGNVVCNSRTEKNNC